MIGVLLAFGVGVYHWSTFLLIDLHIASSSFGLIVLFAVLILSVGSRYFEESAINS